LITEGIAIERKHHKDIKELLKVSCRLMYIGDTLVKAANLPYTLSSDAGYELIKEGQPFGACYYDGPEYRTFSLRSTDTGPDVAKIAESYGGGGHRNASGFRVSHKDTMTLEAMLYD
jgi:nanoRNase/pAp phosphatase (c-di-AMP/oligoRNAs hydrolase)